MPLDPSEEKLAQQVARIFKATDKVRDTDALATDAGNELENRGIYDDEKVERIAERAVEIFLATAVVKADESQGRRKAPQQRKKPRPEVDPMLLTSPYRFVGLPDRVVIAEEAVRRADLARPLKGGFCGTLRVKWAVETPLLIGQSEKSGSEEISVPIKLGADGPYVIPGATSRGAMRAAMEIVCRARLTQANMHHRYGVRDFNHPLFGADSGEGTSRLTWEALGSGWLVKKPAPKGTTLPPGDSDYVLIPCDKRMIRIRALPRSFNNGGETANGAFHKRWLTTQLADRYETAGYVTDYRGKKPVKFDFTKTSGFVRDQSQEGDQYVRPDADGKLKGVYVFSGHSPTAKSLDPGDLDAQENKPDQGDQKKREYVFVDRDGAPEIRLKQDVWDTFALINSKPSKNKRIADGSFAVLEKTLEGGERIPVFFTGNPENQDKSFQFGLTRLFKLAHDYGVGDVLYGREKDQKLDPGMPDMVEALFGHVYEGDEAGFADTPDDGVDLARKGRIAFGFAMLSEKTPARPGPPQKAVMMGARGSFAPFYLRGQHKDWTDEKARLAGRKRYFPRFADGAAAARRIPQTLQETVVKSEKASTDIQSRLRFLMPEEPGDMVFDGEIRFHNVTAAEIGAVLWTLIHGGDPAKPYRHMFGRAKTHGAGQARVKSLELKLVGNDGAAESCLKDPEEWERPGYEGGEGWVTANSWSMTPFLCAFEDHMQKQDANWPRVLDIREFLGVSDPKEGAGVVDAGRARYPDLQNKKANDRAKRNEFNYIRSTTKLDVSLEPARTDLDRYLPAPAVELSRIKRPYRS